MNLAPSRRLRSRTTPWWVLIIGSCYGFLLGVAGSRLTFFAEDYDIFLNQSESGLEVLLLGTGGHWGPISRLLVLGQTHFFGNWYPGYLAINGFLLAVGLMAFATPIARSMNLSQWWVRVAFLQIALVPGVMAVVLLASNGAWALSLCLAGLAAVIACHDKWWQAVVVALASCLSMSGMGIFWVLLAVGVSGAYVLARKPDRFRRWRVFALTSSGLALAIVVIGRIAASYWDSPYFSQYGPDTGSAIVIPSFDLVGIMKTWLVIVATWGLVAMWPAATAVVGDVLPRLAFVLVDYPIVTFAVWLVFFAFLVVLGRCVRSGRWGMILALVISPALLWASAITMLRGDQVHSDRYTFVWLPSLVAFAWVVVSALNRSREARKVRWGTRTLQLLTLSSAVLLLLLLPSTLPMAANMDRPRWEFSREQIALAQDCATDMQVKGLAEVSPAPTQDYLCELTSYLDSIALIR